MTREILIQQLRGVTQSVLDLFRLCPRHRLEFRPSPGMRSLLELCDHFAALPLVDLATLQGNPQHVAKAIEETLHGSGPEDWMDIFKRGALAVEEYFENMPEAEFENRTTRAHFGLAHRQCVWLLEAICHIYHHRGQLFIYLKTLNVPVDIEHLYT